MRRHIHPRRRVATAVTALTLLVGACSDGVGNRLGEDIAKKVTGVEKVQEAERRVDEMKDRIAERDEAIDNVERSFQEDENTLGG